MKKRISRVTLAILFIVPCVFLPACSDESSDPLTNEEITARLQSMVNDAVATDPAIHNAVLMVDAPQRGLVWSGAAGVADPADIRAMTVNDQFRTASIGKMTLATVVMKVIESGALALDDYIHEFLPDAIINGLHIYQGVEYSLVITIHQLLDHTSGLPDYITDGDENSNGLPDFLELLIEDPEKFWTPEETIDYAKQHLKPFFKPGDGFHYSDTNYQLLGLILQVLKQKPLNVIYREELFDLLDMDHTYMEYYDDPIQSIPGCGISHVYFNGYDYTDWTSNSADWAGGGLISTTTDLNRFLRGFVNDMIFQDDLTKSQMLSWTSVQASGLYYGLGILKMDLAEMGLQSLGEIYGHDGFPQSFMFYWPKRDVTITGTLNQAMSQTVTYDQLLLDILVLLDK